MNPVQLWAAIAHPQQNYRIHNDNYLKLQRNPLKQVPQSLNLLPQKKTHVDSFFEVFFATYTFSFLSLLTYNIALHEKNCTSAQKPSNTRARNCILGASSLMSVLNKLPPFRTPKHHKRFNWWYCIDNKSTYSIVKMWLFPHAMEKTHRDIIDIWLFLVSFEIMCPLKTCLTGRSTTSESWQSSHFGWIWEQNCMGLKLISGNDSLAGFPSL